MKSILNEIHVTILITIMFLMRKKVFSFCSNKSFYLIKTQYVVFIFLKSIYIPYFIYMFILSCYEHAIWVNSRRNREVILLTNQMVSAKLSRDHIYILPSIIQHRMNIKLDTFYAFIDLKYI